MIFFFHFLKIFIQECKYLSLSMCLSFFFKYYSLKHSCLTQAKVPDPKWICPDRSRLKVPMSRPSQTESGYVQTMRSSCVRRQICPDHPRPKQYMSRLSCVLVQTIVCSNSISCVQRQIFSASMSRPSCVHVQTIVRSCPDHRAFMSRPSWVHVQTFERSPDGKNYPLGCSSDP